MSIMKDHSLEKRERLLTDVRGIQIFSISVIFSSAAVASSLVFIFIPNLETLSLIFFLVGYLYGIKTGATTVITSVTIYEMFASQFYGTGGLFPFILKFPPFLLIMVCGVYFHHLKMNNNFLGKEEKEMMLKAPEEQFRDDILYQPFDLQKETQEINFSVYERVLLAQLGFVLTIIYDITTSFGILVFVPTWEALFVSFITGLPFFIFHQLTNLILFLTIPSILIAINKARLTR
ncbi:MAG: hypothetical protein ACFFAU_20205 [Candidatus Hodarchaeota archaeon]